MTLSRPLAAVLALCLLLPAALAAAAACGMVDCGMVPGADAHACCPQPEAKLLPGCCVDADPGPAQTPKAPERAPSLAVVQLAGALATAPPALVAAPEPEPAASPPRDLLARHCILRI